MIPLLFLEGGSLRIACALLAVPLACQRFFGALAFTWFQVKGVTLDLLNDVFLLNFTLEAAKRAFQALTVLDVDFCQLKFTCLPTTYLPRIAESHSNTPGKRSGTFD